MSKWFRIEPEVPGGLGDNAVFAIVDGRRVFSVLHVEIDGWLGDDILTCVGNVLATERARQLTSTLKLRAVTVKKLEVTRSSEYAQLFGRKRLPQLHWLQLEGTAFEDDFAIDNKGRLIVSAKTINEFRSNLHLENCDIKPVSPPKRLP